jgi:uncharacterized protein (UPF0332 family)
MWSVGHYLAKKAENGLTPEEVDLFGRSAFNRYYYSAFLEVRAMLRKIKPESAGQDHSGIPLLLKGAVYTQVKTVTDKMRKIDYNASERIRGKTENATKELALLMTHAYAIRRIADYEPETLITDAGKNFRLSNSTVGEAKRWEEKVRANIDVIESQYKESGLI